MRWLLLYLPSFPFLLQLCPRVTAVRKALCQALDTRDRGGCTSLYENNLNDISLVTVGEDVGVAPSSWDHVRIQRGSPGSEIVACQTHMSAMLSVFRNSVIQTLSRLLPQSKNNNNNKNKKR